MAVVLLSLFVLWLRVIKKRWTIDQGSLLALFVAGLYVRLDHVIALVFLTTAIPLLFYMPIVAIRARLYNLKFGWWTHEVPIIPFIVLAAIITSTPYYTDIEVAYRNTGCEEQISAIQQFIEQVKKGQTTFSVSTGDGPEILVSYEKNAVPVESLALRYRDVQPKLVFEYWKTFFEQRKNPRKQSREVFSDLNTGYVFVVAPTFHVLRANDYDSSTSSHR